jgi:hypothetical protein
MAALIVFAYGALDLADRSRAGSVISVVSWRLFIPAASVTGRSLH